MMRMLRAELWKALHNTYFYLALGLGAVIIAMNAFQNASVVQELTEATLRALERGQASGDAGGFSLFNHALVYHGVNFSSALFKTVWPVLAAMPFAWSYSADRRSGMYDQLVVRSSIGQYAIAKYTAVFVSGGLVISLIVLTDLLITALICPYYVFDGLDALSFIGNKSFLSELFYSYPWIHALIWCVVTFFLGGAAAGLAFLVGAKMRLRVLVLLVPYAILTVWNVVYYTAINVYFGEHLPKLEMSPLALIIVSSSKNPEWLVFITIGLLTAVGLGAASWQVKRHELV